MASRGASGFSLLLPDESQLESVRKAASAEWLKGAIETGAVRTVNLSLPKIKMTVGTFKLTQSLKDMGFAPAFEDGADFSGITGDKSLTINDVFHKAFISVDEKGTEAAAATAVTTAGSSAPSNILPLSFDRPFLFFIHDDNGAVLFSGQVVDPSQN